MTSIGHLSFSQEFPFYVDSRSSKFQIDWKFQLGMSIVEFFRSSQNTQSTVRFSTSPNPRSVDSNWFFHFSPNFDDRNGFPELLGIPILHDFKLRLFSGLFMCQNCVICRFSKLAEASVMEAINQPCQHIYELNWLAKPSQSFREASVRRNFGFVPSLPLFACSYIWSRMFKNTTSTLCIIRQSSTFIIIIAVKTSERQQRRKTFFFHLLGNDSFFFTAQKFVTGRAASKQIMATLGSQFAPRFMSSSIWLHDVRVKCISSRVAMGLKAFRWVKRVLMSFSCRPANSKWGEERLTSFRSQLSSFRPQYSNGWREEKKMQKASGKSVFALRSD